MFWWLALTALVAGTVGFFSGRWYEYHCWGTYWFLQGYGMGEKMQRLRQKRNG